LSERGPERLEEGSARGWLALIESEGWPIGSAVDTGSVTCRPVTSVSYRYGGD
jgi:hypothetical protein